METKLKIWTGLGLATALAGTTLTGCSSNEETADSEETSEAAVAGEMGEGEGGEGEGGEGHEIGTLSLPQRLAFMAGHVEAGLALYRAGQPEAAAPHLLHPVSETHAAERAGLEALGFKAPLFEEVSTALEEGRPASEIEFQLRAAEENLRAVRAKAGGDKAGLIRFLMDTAVEEYTIAVKDGKVNDPAEYQDAWGFVTIAHQIAADLEGDRAQDVRKELDQLVAFWPDDAPIPPTDPTPVGQVSALASRISLALSSE